MVNNAIPDSITTNMIRRSLVSSLGLIEPNVRSTDVGITPKNTLRILNTIKLVTRAFTTMDDSKAVRTIVGPQGALFNWPCSNITEPSDASQVAIGNKSKLACQMKIDLLTYVCDRQERRNNHNADIFTPHDPTTVGLRRFK